MTDPDIEREDRRAARWAVPLMCWALFVVLALTTFPYTLSDAAAVRPTPAPWWPGGVGRRLADLLGNLALFVPLGFALGAWAQRRLARTTGGDSAPQPGARTARVLAFALVLSAAIEGLQLRLPGRDPEWHDLLANLVGAWCGLVVWRRWAGPVLTALGAASRLALGVPALVALLIVPLWAFAAADFSARWQAAAHTSNWNDSHPLLIGNEATGDRPWQGVIRRLALGDTVVVDQGAAIPALTWRGAGPPTGDERAADGPAADEPAADTYAAQDGLVLDGTRWLMSEGPATQLNRALADAGAFTLELDLATRDVTQSGPARIVSLGYDEWHRNLMLGQQGDALVLRLRTPATGRNGSDPEWVVPGVFSDTARHALVITWDGTTARLSVDGIGRGGAFRITPGGAAFGGLLDPKAELLWGWQVLFLLLLCAPPAKAAAIFAARSGRTGLGLAAALITPLAVELWTAHRHPRGVQLDELALAVGLAVFIYTVTGLWLSAARADASTAPEVL